MPESLIVPMAVDALLVNDSNKNNKTVEKWKANFSRLQKHGPVEPPERSTLSDESDLGIFIQWDLPAALRTGQPDDSAATYPAAFPPDIDQPHLETSRAKFPLIPNRWLVVRQAFPTSQSQVQPQVRSWLIRSDEMPPLQDEPGKGRTEDYPAFLPGTPNPKTTGGYPSAPGYGVVYPLDSDGNVPAEPGTDLFLTADSTGLPGFCRFQPYNHGILSFHDRADDLIASQTALKSTGQEITVNYLVVGWYSDPSKDLIKSATKAADLPEALKKLGWTLPDSVKAVDVTGTVYVGTVLGVPWTKLLDPAAYKTTDATLKLEGRPDVTNLQAAVGQNSIEACTAVLGKSQMLNATMKTLFEAFQYGLLDSPGRANLPDHTTEPLTDYALEYARHDMSFSATSGSRCWQLAPSSSQSNDEANKKGTPLPQLTDNEKESLASLNKAQKAYDTLDRQLQDLVTRLKGLWWVSSSYTPTKIGRDYTPKETPPPAATTAIKDLSKRIQDCAHQRKLHASQIPSGKTAEEFLESLKKWERENKINERLMLQPMPLAPFRQTANPVITLQGLQDPRRSPELDGYLGGPLPVRPLSQLTVKNPLPLPLPDKLTGLVSQPVKDSLNAITSEFSVLLGAVTQGVRQPGADQQKQRANPTGTGSSLGQLLNNVPYTRWWHQPWRPLYITWSAEIYPSQLNGEIQSQAASYHYAFGTTNPADPKKPGIPQYFHREEKGTRQIPDGAVRLVTGCTFLQPLLGAHTQYRLEHANSLTSDDDVYKAFKDLQDKIRSDQNWDLLSVNLAGVNEALAGRRPDIVLPTRSAPAGRDDDLTYTPPLNPNNLFATPHPKVLGAQVAHLPLDTSKKLSTTAEDSAAHGDQYFACTRSGQMRLTELTIIDSFGRVLKPDQRTMLVAGSLSVQDPTRSYSQRGSSNLEASGLIDLRPRLHQGARLRFDLLTNAARPVPLTDLPDTSTANPVHGWLMATRLGKRQALLCYDPQGQPLFDLHCLGKGPATPRPLPGCNPQFTAGMKSEAFRTAHPILWAFLKPLLQDDTSNGSLPALLYSLDHGLATITPPSPQGPDSRPLSLLLGRPCALVSARLRLELDGPPLTAPSIDALAKGTEADRTPWPVHLGDPHLHGDALLGYFLQGKFTEFHTAHPVDQNKQKELDTKSYTQPIDPAKLTVIAQDPTRSTPGDPDPQITMLVCPHSSVHATTDIVPTARLTLPSQITDQALSTIRPAFPLGPVMAPLPVPDPTTPPNQPAPLTMPFPDLGLEHSQWAWAAPQPNQSWAFHRLEPLQPTDEAPVTTTEAHTGYLQLRPEDTTKKPG
ncbi:MULTISPECIES: hypothetical protein [Streptomyces]|uniref:hypothetical protein n=1 Tax=Streptomyces TaxID=1883 RepID=UPI00345C14FF